MKIWQVFLATPIIQMVNIEAETEEEALKIGQERLLPGYQALAEDPHNFWGVKEGVDDDDPANLRYKIPLKEKK